MRSVERTLAVVVALGVAAPLFAGCSRWSLRPEERHYAEGRRPGVKKPWPNAPRPCSACHRMRLEPSSPPTPKRLPACEPYLLVGGGGDFEVVHLPQPDGKPTDCSLLVSPLETGASAVDEPEAPLTEGLYRLVWRESEGVMLPRPVAGWQSAPRSEPTVRIVMGGPGETPEVDVSVGPDGGPSVVVLPVRYPPEREPSPPPTPSPKPVRVAHVGLESRPDGRIVFELLLDGGNRRIDLAQTEARNTAFDSVDCGAVESVPNPVLCKGEFDEGDELGGFQVWCEDAAAGLCLTVFFSTVPL